MGINSISSCHVETVVCLSKKNAKPKDYVEIGVDAEDYYRIKERKNYNVGSGDGKVPSCPPEKEEAIMDAFRHFNLI